MKPLSVVLLNLLNERPAHSYDLLGTLRRRRDDLRMRVSPGSVYRAVQELAETGLIRVAGIEIEGNRPERTVYQVTEAGQEALSEQIKMLVTNDERPLEPFYLGLSMIDDLDRETVVSLLRQRRAQLGLEMESAEELTDSLAEAGLPRRLFLDHDFARNQTQSEMEWISQTLTEIESGQLSWDSVVPTDLHGKSFRDHGRSK